MPYRHLTLLFLALASCAPRTEAPTEYQKGAYRPTPTRPPAFSPTTDAPHTYRPERHPDVQPQPRLPAVPHTPKTRSEPTIWAAKPPASAPDTPGLLLDLVLPYPPGMDSPEEQAPANLCAEDMQTAVDAAIPRTVLVQLIHEDRKCLAARLYAQCATYLLHMDISLINSALRYDAAWSRGLDALVDTALKRMKQECEGRSGRTDLNDMVRKTMEERMIRAGGVK